MAIKRSVTDGTMDLQARSDRVKLGSDLYPGSLQLQTRSMKAAITDLIRGAIIDGRFPLGSQVSEKTIATDLNVSRTPVREAFQVLQAEGLMEIRAQSGSYVFSTSAEEIVAVCEMRLVLETAAFKMGVARHRGALADRLERVVRDASTRLRADLEGVHRLDTQFHRTLIEGSGNSFLTDAYGTVADRLHALRQLLPLSRVRLSKALADHQALIDAVRAADVQQGELLLSAHISHVEKMLLQRVPSQAEPQTKVPGGLRRDSAPSRRRRR